MPREFSRHQRLASEVLRTLSELLRFETKDPRLQRISLTAVDLSRDLSVARIYFSMLDPDEAPDEAVTGLERAAGFLRSCVADRMRSRSVPTLKFKHDNSMEEGAAMDALIQKARASDANQDED